MTGSAPRIKRFLLDPLPGTATWPYTVHVKKILKMRQIVAAPFMGTRGGMTYSLLGLGRDGTVYRYDNTCDGWLPYSMEQSGCAKNVKEHRRGPHNIMTDA